MNAGENSLDGIADTIKVTSPGEKGARTLTLAEAISAFERELDKKDKGGPSYVLTIEKRISYDLMQQVCELYRNAGWRSVQFPPIGIETTSLYLMM